MNNRVEMWRRDLPAGDRFEDAFRRFQNKHHGQGSLLKEVERLLRLQQMWDFGVFLALTEEEKERKIRETLKKLDKDESS